MNRETAFTNDSLFKFVEKYQCDDKKIEDKYDHCTSLLFTTEVVSFDMTVHCRNEIPVPSGLGQDKIGSKRLKVPFEVSITSTPGNWHIRINIIRN